MTAIANRTDFLRIVEMSKLVDAAVLDAAIAGVDLPESPSELAEMLIQQGVLTRFQSRQLLAGKHRGFVLGPYRLLDQIGQGGMGTVFLAEHAALKRRVALKVLSREHAENPAAVDRFQREARAASALCHPNIMRVHHVGNAGGVHYLVMEHVDGATLESLIDRKGPFTVEEAAQIAAQTATGLHHAHEKGFVHRDIKPENLMVTRAGSTKILDMGLTKSMSRAEDNLTGILKVDVILGTIDYLSPEQAISSNVDARADIYSLGATLFTLLTGHSPYEGVPTKQKLMQHQFGAVPNVQAFRPDVPDGLAVVVAKMMAKKPDDRYQTTLQVIEALAPWVGDAALAINLPSGAMRGPVRETSLTPTATEALTTPDLSHLIVPSTSKPKTEFPGRLDVAEDGPTTSKPKTEIPTRADFAKYPSKPKTEFPGRADIAVPAPADKALQALESSQKSPISVIRLPRVAKAPPGVAELPAEALAEMVHGNEAVLALAVLFVLAIAGVVVFFAL